MLTARLATPREGILMGESCGTALWAALQLAREVDDPDALFVVLLPDSGRNYVGKLYSDDWLGSEGCSGADEQVADYDWRGTTAEVVLRGADIPQPRVDPRAGSRSASRRPALAALGLLVAIDASRVRDAAGLVGSSTPRPTSIGSSQSAHVR